jgi:regulator of chromosome condensation
MYCIFIQNCRLGYTVTENQIIPKKVEQVSNVVEVKCGYSHVICRTSDNKIYIWGKTIDVQNTPVLVNFPVNEPIAKVNAGFGCSGILTESGKLYLFGKNSTGKLGFGDVTVIPAPKLLEGYSVRDFSLGYDTSIFCTTDGQVYTMGSNDYFQLGIGKDKKAKNTPQLVPLPYDSNDPVIQVSSSVGSPHNCHSGCVTQNGVLFMWGNGYKFKLGTGTLDDQPTPVRVHYFDNIPVLKLICGGIHNQCITKDQSVYSWGCGSDGRLGHPESDGHRYLYKEEEPRRIDFDNNQKVKDLSAGYYSVAAVMQ